MFKNYYKSIIAFLTPFGMFLAYIAADPTILATFSTQAVWLTGVGVPLLTAFLTWLKRNEPTVSKAEKILSHAKHRRPES